MSTPLYSYRLSTTTDPEERLEDAAMWKALHDVHGDNIKLIAHDGTPPAGSVFFGRTKTRECVKGEVDGAGLRDIRYYENPGFLNNCGRDFHVLDLDGAMAKAEQLHAAGKDVFLKAVRDKFYTERIPVGQDPTRTLGDMAFSFMGDEPSLMVQEALDMRFEQRFLFVGEDCVTSSTVAYHLTPMDRSWLSPDQLYERPDGKALFDCRGKGLGLQNFARKAYEESGLELACVDCAWDWKTRQPVVVEFNPFHIGQIGLFACDPREIAKASRHPVFKHYPVPGKPDMSSALDEVECEYIDDNDSLSEPLSFQFSR